ncbi:hypothetical protein [Flavobacterium sp. 25HG05S-40]|uniref:hypothetical protein n=1 Tax=Flavobacterium sp. 25HG05S-40 TaxID=3458682 RepID=UPI00404404B6
MVLKSKTVTNVPLGDFMTIIRNLQGVKKSKGNSSMTQWNYMMPIPQVKIASILSETLAVADTFVSLKNALSTIFI